MFRGRLTSPGRTRSNLTAVRDGPDAWWRLSLARDSRHTTACHLVFAGVDINTVRAWLGHSSINTTNIYAEIDLKMKARAMALCDVAVPGPARPWKENKGLMAFLKSL